ncbi:MAG: hypothetical protein L6R48_07405 [Planctomycetes bacterium]|nr:hypothetical protein [Planctomycetota bacterium]
MAAALLVLGMHRSGTSCLAGMLAAGGARPPGAVVRNWDNRHGHHEAAAAVRLDEAVLAHSGGSWIEPPAACRWTEAHAAERDHLLAPVAGCPALIKDPRALLCLDFWLAARPAPRLLAIVRHPLAVARSLLAWRRLPADDGLRLWLAHNRPLAALAARQDLTVLDFDRPRTEFLAAAQRAIGALAPELACDHALLAGCYAAEQVHHGGGGALPADPELLAEALSLHRRLGGGEAGEAGCFPWDGYPRFLDALAAGDEATARTAAAACLAAAGDPAAVLAPAVGAWLRAGRPLQALALVETAPAACEPALLDLLRGKAALAAGQPEPALAALTRACAVSDPYFEARTLHAHALRGCGRGAAARAALAALAGDAVHPHEPLSTLAEWAWADGDLAAAQAAFAEACDRAPPHRRGRLRCRLAELLRLGGDLTAALAQLDAAQAEDPGYGRVRELRRLLG